MKKLLLMFFVLFAVSFGNAQESIPPSSCESMGGTWYYCEDEEFWEIWEIIREACGEASPGDLKIKKINCD